MKGKPKKRINAKTNGFTFFFRIVKFFFITMVILVLAGGAVVGKMVLGIAKDAPEISTQKFTALNVPSIVVDSNGQQYDILHTDEVRFPLPLAEMGENIQKAFVSIEDERFYLHQGVDYRRTISVAVQDVVGRFTGNRSMQGGSTLTQQMIKNVFLTRDKDYTRKIKEIFMALEAEKVLTKEQILETYLNSIFLGGKAHGVEAAARQYFSKSAKDLSIIEAAYIAGTTQSPSVYYAFSDSSKANPSRYINRTKLVLQAMLKNERISQAEYDAAYAEINANGIAFNGQSIITDKYAYEYFTRPVLDQVRNDLKEIKGMTDEEISDLISYGGLTIHTTMNRAAQDYAQSILNDFGNINTEYKHKRFREATAEEIARDRGLVTFADGSKWMEYYTTEQAQASFAAMDYKTGQVQVLIGGRNDDTASGFHRAYYSPTFGNSFTRSIGSTTKPMTIYGAGLDSGKITMASEAKDMKIEESIYKPLGFNNAPQNVTFTYSGMSSIRKAIVQSYNTVSVRTYNTIGKETSLSYGRAFGLVFTGDERNLQASTFALGSNFQDSKDGGNPLILATAYGAFANGGVVTDAVLYTKITDRLGNVILENIPSSRQVIKPQTAYILYDVMTDIVKSNVPRTRLTSMPIAGKTGTSNGVEDVWFAGVSPYYSASMWMGADQRAELFRAGSTRRQTSFATQDAYGKIMKFLHEGKEVTTIPRPSGLVQGSFCVDSGDIPNSECIALGKARSDLFIQGTQPNSICTLHVREIIEPEAPESPTVVPPGNVDNGTDNSVALGNRILNALLNGRRNNDNDNN
jgi:penicillin-binding protein 1A